MQQLLKHFHELSLHPGNAQKLKALILELATQGKLTRNWRAENPHFVADQKLLDRIKSYNKDLLSKKKRRVKVPKVKSESSIDIPENWLRTYNYELFTLQKGKNPNDLSESEKKFPYMDVKALDKGVIRRYSDDEKAVKCSANDILVVCDGSRSGLVLNGKDGIVGSTLAVIETPPFIQEIPKANFFRRFSTS